MEENLNKYMKKIIETIGYGFQEIIYQNALCYELRQNNHEVKNEVNFNVMYGLVELGSVRADIIVDDKYIIEMKTNLKLKQKDEIQLKKYLRLANKNEGFLINIGEDNYEVKSINFEKIF